MTHLEGADPGREPRAPWRPPTLADVARQAGVSKATASRALNAGRSARSPAAAAQVRQAADRLGYTGQDPDLPRLLVLTSAVARTGYWSTLSGVQEAAQEHDTNLPDSSAYG